MSSVACPPVGGRRAAADAKQCAAASHVRPSVADALRQMQKQCARAAGGPWWQWGDGGGADG